MDEQLLHKNVELGRWALADRDFISHRPGQSAFRGASRGSDKSRTESVLLAVVVSQKNRKPCPPT